MAFQTRALLEFRMMRSIARSAMSTMIFLTYVQRRQSENNEPFARVLSKDRFKLRRLYKRSCLDFRETSLKRTFGH